jgi:hypothetical protein
LWWLRQRRQARLCDLWEKELWEQWERSKDLVKQTVKERRGGPQGDIQGLRFTKRTIRRDIALMDKEWRTGMVRSAWAASALRSADSASRLTGAPSAKFPKKFLPNSQVSCILCIDNLAGILSRVAEG